MMVPGAKIFKKKKPRQVIHRAYNQEFPDFKF